MIKESVDLRGIHPVWGIAHPIIRDLYRAHGYKCVITSGTEIAKHRLEHSLHYKGKALDFRIHHVHEERKPVLIATIKQELGPQFDVVHKNPGLATEHLHIEFDPREPAKEDEL